MVAGVVKDVAGCREGAVSWFRGEACWSVQDSAEDAGHAIPKWRWLSFCKYCQALIPSLEVQNPIIQKGLPIEIVWDQPTHPSPPISFKPIKNSSIVLVNTTGCRRHVPLSWWSPAPHIRLPPIMQNMHRGVYYAKYCSCGRGERDCCMGDKLKMHLLGKNLIRGKREEKIDHKGV